MNGTLSCATHGGKAPLAVLRATKILPALDIAFAGTDEPIWTRQEFDSLMETFYSTLSKEERACFAICVRPDESDKTAMLLQAQGTHDDLEILLQHLTHHEERRLKELNEKKQRILMSTKRNVLSFESTTQQQEPSPTSEAHVPAPSSLIGTLPFHNSYFLFRQKFQESIRFEFERSGIHLASVASRMWKRHKALFGPNCDNACNAKKKTAAEWKNPLQLGPNDIPVGFMTNFARKFLPLLRSKFSNESPARLLQRLNKMWRRHLQLRQYEQSKCSSSCRCRESWATDFSEGALRHGHGPDDTVPARATAPLPKSGKRSMFVGDAAVASTSRLLRKKKARVSDSVDKERSADAFAAVTSDPSKISASAIQPTLKPLPLTVSIPRNKSTDTALSSSSSMSSSEKPTLSLPNLSSSRTGSTADRQQWNTTKPGMLISSTQQLDDKRSDVFLKEWRHSSLRPDGVDRPPCASSTPSPLTMSRDSTASSTHKEAEQESESSGVCQQREEYGLMNPPRELVNPDWLTTLRPASVGENDALHHFDTSVEESPVVDAFCNAVQMFSVSRLIGFLKQGTSVGLSSRDFKHIRSRVVAPTLARSLGEYDQARDLTLYVREWELKDMLLNALTHAALSLELASAVADQTTAEFELNGLTGKVILDLQKLYYPTEIYVSHDHVEGTGVQSVVKGLTEPAKIAFPSGKVASNVTVHGSCCNLEDKAPLILCLTARLLQNEVVEIGRAGFCSSSIFRELTRLKQGDTFTLDLVPPVGGCLQSGARLEFRIRKMPNVDISCERIRSHLHEIVIETFALLEKFGQALSKDDTVSGFIGVEDLWAGEHALTNLMAGIDCPILKQRLITAENLLSTKPSAGKIPHSASEVDDSIMNQQNLAAQDAFAPRSVTFALPRERSVLPLVDPEWVVDSANITWRCKYHEADGKGCLYRNHTTSHRGCKFIHIHRPWGPLFDGLVSSWEGQTLSAHAQLRSDLQSLYNVKAVKDNEGKLWYTAKYSSVRSGQAHWQDVIFAEGGDYRVNEQGVCWYCSEEEARRAIQQAVFVTFMAIEKNLRPEGGVPGPFQLLPQLGSENTTPQVWHCVGTNTYGLMHQVQGTLNRSREGSHYVRVQGLPYTATKEEIIQFLQSQQVFCDRLAMVFGKDRRFTGIANLYFSSHQAAKDSLFIDNSRYRGLFVRLKMITEDQFLRAQNSEQWYGT